MLYTQYKEASLKHLQACKTAVHGLKFYHGRSAITSNLAKPNRDALLLNIFYLCGYTLECIINYAICKKISWTSRSVKEMYDVTKNVAFYKEPYDPPYGRGKARVRLTSGRDFIPSYYFAQHKFNINVQLLHILLPGNVVPLVNSSIPVAANLQRMIFDPFNGSRNNHCWKPDIRYLPASWFASNYTEQDVLDLVELTEQVYIHLQSV